MTSGPQNLQRGDTGRAVVTLQGLLMQLGYVITPPETEAQRFGADTEEAVKAFQETYGLDIDGVVDPPFRRRLQQAIDEQPGTTDPPDEPTPDDNDTLTHRVFGQVLQANGAAIIGVKVHALHQNLRSTIPLGDNATTNDDGRYTIRYTPPSELKAIDLIVWAGQPNAAGEFEEIARSQLICNALRDEEVNLVEGNVTYRGPSEFAELQQATSPHLDGTNLADLTAEDTELLACKTGQPALHLAYAARAKQLESGTSINLEVLYGLFRQGLPTGTGHLLKQSPAALVEAVKAAVADNIISDNHLQDLETIVQRFEQAAIRHGLEPAHEGFPAALGDLLSHAGLTSEQQQQLLTSYLAHDGSIDTFWRSLAANDILDAAAVERTQHTLQLALLTGSHLPLITALQERGLNSLPALANLDKAAWESLIAQTGTPPQIPGHSPSEQASYYQQAIDKALAEAYPTTTLVAQLNFEAIPQGRDVAAFFERNPEFDFKQTTLKAYLTDHSDALAGAADAEGTLAQLKTIERLFKVTPTQGKAANIEALLSANLGSAYAIQRKGKAAFLRELTPVLGETTADTIFAKANRTAGLTANLVARYAPTINRVSPRVIHTGSLEVATDAQRRANSRSGLRSANTQLPDLESLFGSLDICACEHCASIFSPAAYLVDLLSWLENRPAIGGGTALDVLFNRRDDIGDIDLTCENTETLMPYVDLVHEILEQVVVSTSLTAYQTDWDTATQQAQPEHLNPAAYDVLRSDAAVYPFSLPFDLWVLEARTYLEHLGVNRYDLMELFQDSAAPSSQARDIAAEQLGLTSLQRQIITGAITDRLDEFWGYPPDAVSSGGLNLVNELKPVETFLHQSGLTFEELAQLLAVPYVNRTEIAIDWTDAPCDLSTAVLENLNSPTLNRAHRFLRLWRQLGWSIDELGAIINRLPPHDLNDTFIVQLATFQQIQTALGEETLPLLTLWSPINTTAYGDADALYDTLFLDKTVTGDADALAAFQLNSSRDELADPISHSLDDHTTNIIAGLGITDEDLSTLRAVELLDDSLNLANLSALYRATLLAHGLDLSIADYATLRTLCDIDPFIATDLSQTLQFDLSQTLQFIEVAEHIAQSAFTLPQLDYLLRHEDAAGAFVPAESQIILVFNDIRTGLEQLEAEASFTNTTAAIQTATLLSTLLPPENVSTSQSIIEGTASDDVATQETFVRDHWPFLDEAFITAFGFSEPTATFSSEEIGSCA